MNWIRDRLAQVKRRWSEPTPREIVCDVAADLVINSDQPVSLGELKKGILNGLVARRQLNERTTLEAARWIRKYADHNPWPKTAGMV